MHDVKLMKIRYSSDDMLEESACFKFVQFCLFYDIVEELTLLDILHNQKKVLWCFDDLNITLNTS